MKNTTEFSAVGRMLKAAWNYFSNIRILDVASTAPITPDDLSYRQQEQYPNKIADVPEAVSNAFYPDGVVEPGGKPQRPSATPLAARRERNKREL